MARKRNNGYRRPRQAPGSERSFHAYQVDLPAPVTSRGELVRMLRGGEDTYLELKVRFSNVEKLTAEIIALANTAGLAELPNRSLTRIGGLIAGFLAGGTDDVDGNVETESHRNRRRCIQHVMDARHVKGEFS